MESYQDINAQTIDRWVSEGWEWGMPVDHETFARATQGDWEVQLTPTKMVPKAWFGNLTGKDVLGLACGGGQQGPLFVAAGAHVTILDYAETQLASERLVADREGYDVTIVRAETGRISRTKPGMINRQNMRTERNTPVRISEIVTETSLGIRGMGRTSFRLQGKLTTRIIESQLKFIEKR